MNIKSWKVLPFNKDEAAEIAQRYAVPSIIAMVLQSRGIVEDEQIRALVEQEEFTESPFDLLDMDKAVNRIRRAIDEFESIAIYGDYDADGITATSILYTYLESMDSNVMYYIPMREGDGYGLNSAAVESLYEKGVKLIITVDNGISSGKEVERAAELGMEVIITDHHRPQGEIPGALAVIDPYRPDCPSKFKDYAGAGIALKLVVALEWDVSGQNDALDHYGDLAAIGTIGDVVPLLGENRAIVKSGLKRITHSDRQGIITLSEKSGITRVTSTTVAYSLVPRINATGRMGAPGRAVELLTTEFEDDALVLSESICEDNELRRETENQITAAATQKIESDNEIKYGRIIVVEGEDWHCGVIGIVAAKIMERYGKPVMVISVSGDEAKGSGRSYEGFSLFDAVSSCADLLVRFGGHHMAAGITIATDKIRAFRKAINTYAGKINRYMPGFPVNIDLKLVPTALNVDIPKNLSMLEPFGKGNPYPVFGLFTMELKSITPVGGGNHLRLGLRRGGLDISCMRFGCRAEEFPFEIGTVLDLAVVLDSKEYKGAETLTVVAKELKISEIDMDMELISYRRYEMFKSGQGLYKDEAEDITPTRDDIAKVYRLIGCEKESLKNPVQMLSKLSAVSLGKLLTCLDILVERKLITVTGDELMKIAFNKTEEKTDIYASSIFTRIKEQIT